MNKRYIDFVPSKQGAAGAKRQTVKGTSGVAARTPGQVSVGVGKTEARKVAEKTAARRRAARITRAETAPEMPLEEMFEERAPKAGVSTGLREPKFGVIEDYQPKFVQAEVKKRPLGGPRKAASSGGAAADAKAAKAAEKATRAARMAKPAFINAEKVEKRALSDGLHPKKTAEPAVKPAKTKKFAKKSADKTGKADKVKKSDGPVRIIAEPEKDSRAGIIIAVILTIILGAAAGTVAFLLLPK